jgi:hypothetical protein
MGIKYFDDFEGTWIEGPKVYAGIFGQGGSSAPSVSILDNTLGEIIWEYDSVGIYYGYLDGAFPTHKFPLRVYTFGMQDDYYYYVQIERINDGTIRMTTKDYGFNKQDDLLSEAFIEFKVYP